MSPEAAGLLEKVKKLPVAEQQEISRELIVALRATPEAQKLIPRMELDRGILTAEQVAEILDKD